MKNNTDYLYYRQLYSNYYYTKKGVIKIELKNGETKYLYFNSDNHMKFTESKKYATRFSRKPKNYDNYVEYIKRQFLDANVIYEESVVVKNKFE